MIDTHTSLGAGQGRWNRIEHLIAHHLADHVIESLTDRSGGIHEFPWTPNQRVRVGVLSPTFAPAGVPPTNTENNGVIGVDFVVRTDAEQFSLDIDVSYAIYHALWQRFATVAHNAQQATSSNPSGRANVKMESEWQRDDRRLTITVPVSVTATESTFRSLDMSPDPLAADAQTAVQAHYQSPEARFPLTNNQTLPANQVAPSAADYVAARNQRRDNTWSPQFPIPVVTIATNRLDADHVAVSVSLTNELVIQDRDKVQDLALYDARMSVAVQAPGAAEPQRLRFAADDPRYDDVATVAGRGRGCVAVSGRTANELFTETLPIFVQPHMATSQPANVDATFADLAVNWRRTLPAISTAMREFLRSWNTAVASPQATAYLTELRNTFEREVERFELGCDLLRRDSRLSRAFELANLAFAAARPSGSWRMFQLVFIVSELGALAIRENPNDTQLREELDAADVLWFPTGGGKTEAYLGLIAVALFFDRLRDKERGTSAWMLFPLRMLSVQQLARVHEIVFHADVIRARERIGGDAFSLGYLVGSGNTPNRLASRAQNGWWPGLAAFAQWSEEDRDERRLVGACPTCGDSDSVGLDADVAAARLLHVCRNCAAQLTICASDDEVYRYQPSVLVSTVDKITSFAFQGQLTAINRGPRRKCPDHGWYTHDKCVVQDCSTDVATHLPPTGFKDPTPALWVQDELHLVREDLGVFAAHYHTLLAELAVGAGNLPSKVIAATATIEQYEDQLAQVYGRTPRLFPTGGPTLERSFYTERTEDVRRLYLGVLPAGGGTVKVDVAGRVTASLLELVHHLTDNATPLIGYLASHGVTATAAEIEEHLFNYELALAYVNSKTHGVNILDDVHRKSDALFSAGSDPIKAEYLSGETTLGKLAETVSAIEDGTLSTPRAERIRALVGTSVVSHGVDLSRLNVEVLAGMPPSYAHYIQATARSGRRFVGLVVSVFDRSNRRECSMYQSFMTTHAALERMVEPVPVNRFASRAFERTLPGITAALLWDETRDATWGTTTNISATRNLQRWWAAHAVDVLNQLDRRIPAAFSCPVPQAAYRDAERRLRDAALDRWQTVEKPAMERWSGDFLTDLFNVPVMASLRDVTDPVDFAAMWTADQIVTAIA